MIYQRQKIKKYKAKGYVLISVMVIMTVLITMTYLFSDALFSEMAIAQNQQTSTITFHLAEAGAQEAIWRIQHDSTTRNTFLNTTNGLTTFSNNDSLVSGGSYEVSIQNTAQGSGTITSTGLYQKGIKKAQRKIRVQVTKATTPPPYNYNGAIFTGGATGEEDVTFYNTTLNITDNESPHVANLISNRDIWIDKGSVVNIANDILAKREVRVSSDSNVSTGGSIQENVLDSFDMPSIDVTSENANSYKSLAQAQNQYYSVAEFEDLMDSNNPLILDGIVYVAGSGITIDRGQTVKVNGILVSEGSIDVGSPNRRGVLTVNHVEGAPSGVITLSKFNAWAGAVVNIEGLVYVGDRFSYDPFDSSDPESEIITVEGAFLCRRFGGFGSRTINITLNTAWVNEALEPNPDETPVIQVQHWEEEY